jgi:ATP-dependent protease ClpP protease subunit
MMTTFRFRGDQPPTEASRASLLADTTDTGTATLYLYDPIDSWGGVWGVSAKEFAVALAALPAGTGEIRLHINSPGGEVWDAMAIVNQLREYPAKVVAVVDGIAASAASFIAAAADELVMGIGSQLMIHDAWNIAIGNEQDMLDMAARLSRDSQGAAAVYAAKAGGTVDEWRALMRAETWYTADEAVAAGLADSTVEDPASNDKAKAALKGGRSLFRYAGRAEAPAPGQPMAVHLDPPAAPESGNTHTQQEEDSMSALSDGLRTRLGITDAALDEDGLLAALDEALTERSEPETQTPSALPAGTIAIDEATYAQLLEDGKAGREARAEQLANKRVAAVDKAVQEGRIPLARRGHWLEQLEADPGAAETLAKLAPVIPTEEIGLTGGVDEASDDELANYRAIYHTKEA